MVLGSRCDDSAVSAQHRSGSLPLLEIATISALDTYWSRRRLRSIGHSLKRRSTSAFTAGFNGISTCFQSRDRFSDHHRSPPLARATMNKLALPIILALVAVMNYALAGVIWYFSSRSDEYNALMKRIQPPDLAERISHRGTSEKRKMLTAAGICAIIATGVLVAAVWVLISTV